MTLASGPAVMTVSVVNAGMFAARLSRDGRRQSDYDGTGTGEAGHSTPLQARPTS